MYACAQVRSDADQQATNPAWRVLVAYENVQETPQTWSSVLQWHAHDTHVLFMCRKPDDLHNLKFDNHVPQLNMPSCLHVVTEFPEMLTRLLQRFQYVDLDDAQRARLYQLTNGVPLAVKVAVSQLGGERSVSQVLDDFEKSGHLGDAVYGDSIARLDDSARSVLQCLAHFEADDLPETLFKAVVAEVLVKRGTALGKGSELAMLKGFYFDTPRTGTITRTFTLALALTLACSRTLSLICTPHPSLTLNLTATLTLILTGARTLPVHLRWV